MLCVSDIQNNLWLARNVFHKSADWQYVIFGFWPTGNMWGEGRRGRGEGRRWSKIREIIVVIRCFFGASFIEKQGTLFREGGGGFKKRQIMLPIKQLPFFVSLWIKNKDY